MVLEYSDPPPDPGEEGRAGWQLPARVLMPAEGPAVLLNRDELETRLDSWLARAGWTRAMCGRLIFTWNAFRIECDPDDVPAGLVRFDPGAAFPGAGGRIELAGALGSALFEAAAGGEVADGVTRHVAVLPVDPDAVQRDRATIDVGVAELTGETVSFDQALVARAEEEVTGTVTVSFDVDEEGIVRRRRDVATMAIRRPDGVVESTSDQVVVERRTQ